MGAWGHGALAVSGGAGPLGSLAGPGTQQGSGGNRGGGGQAEECGRAAGGAAPPPGAARAGRRRERRAGRGRARESGRAAGGPRQGVAAGPTGPRGRWAAVGSCCPCPETPRTWPGRPPPRLERGGACDRGRPRPNWRDGAGSAREPPGAASPGRSSRDHLGRGRATESAAVGVRVRPRARGWGDGAPRPREPVWTRAPSHDAGLGRA